MLRGCLIILTITQLTPLFGQIRLATFVNAGKDHASKGFYLQNAGIFAYNKKRWSMEGGYQIDIVGASGQLVTGTYLKITQSFNQFRIPFALQGVWMYNPYSQLVHESNYAAQAKVNLTYVYLSAGTHIRQYRITKSAVKKYSVAPGNKHLTEFWNWVYQIKIQRFREPHPWNIGVAASNIDQFSISPERNPMFCFFGRLRIRTRMSLYLES